MNITSASGSGTNVSEVTFQTDRFKIYNGSTGQIPFYVDSGNVYIDNARIRNLTASNLTAGTITANEISVGTITADRVVDLGITTGKIAANAISTMGYDMSTSFSMSSGNTYNAVSVSASGDTSYKAIVMGTVSIQDVGTSPTTEPDVWVWLRGGSTGLLYAYRRFTWPIGGHTTATIFAPIPSVGDTQYVMDIEVVNLNGGGIALSPLISITEFKK
jgi:hypothetical protein